MLKCKSLKCSCISASILLQITLVNRYMILGEFSWSWESSRIANVGSCPYLLRL